MRSFRSSRSFRSFRSFRSHASLDCEPRRLRARLFPVLGLVPFSDGPQTVVTKWHRQCREKGKPQRKPHKREGGRQRHHRGVQNPFPSSVCSPLRGVATLRVMQTLCGKPAKSACNKRLCQVHRLPVLGLMPVKL